MVFLMRSYFIKFLVDYSKGVTNIFIGAFLYNSGVDNSVVLERMQP